MSIIVSCNGVDKTRREYYDYQRGKRDLVSW